MTSCKWLVTSCSWLVTSCNWLVTSCSWLVTSCKWLVTSCSWQVTSCNWLVTSCRWLVTSCKWLVTSAKWLVAKWLVTSYILLVNWQSDEWNENHLSTITAVNLHYYESSLFLKVSLKPYNYKVPVYKGLILPWMKWKPSFNDNCRQTILLWKLSLSKKWVSNHTNLGPPMC